MMELIHTSDWHLGNPFSAFDQAQQRRLTEARFEGVKRLFAYARDHGIRLMLCAGDQIDNGELRDTAILLRLFGIISSYPEVQVVMIAGNHDPLTPSSVYARVDPASYPKNLLFVREPRPIDLPELGVHILAAPLTERFGRSNPIEELCRSDSAASGGGPESVVVGLAHGSAAVNDTVGGGSDAFPIPPQLAKQAGVDYLALGDWHSYLALGERTFYPGTHEPLAFGDDSGSLHVKLAERGARPTVERIAGSIFHWTEVERTLTDDGLEVLLSDLASPEEPSPARADAGEGGESGQGGAAAEAVTLMRLRLSGFLSFDRFKRLEEGLAVAGERYFALFAERLPEIRPSDNELGELGEAGYMKRVIERLIELAAGEGEEAAAAESALLTCYSFFHSAARDGGVETDGGVKGGAAKAARPRKGRP